MLESEGKPYDIVHDWFHRKFPLRNLESTVFCFVLFCFVLKVMLAEGILYSNLGENVVSAE